VPPSGPSPPPGVSRQAALMSSSSSQCLPVDVVAVVAVVTVLAIAVISVVVTLLVIAGVVALLPIAVVIGRARGAREIAAAVALDLSVRVHILAPHLQPTDQPTGRDRRAPVPSERAAVAQPVTN
jgi:hypothetical protein